MNRLAYLDDMADRDMPRGLILEKPAKSLAALVTNESFTALQSTVLSQWERPELFEPLARHGIMPTNLVLFYGPPGNGKTFSSQAIASRLDCPLYRVATESLVTANLGSSTANVGRVMDWLSQAGRCVVLLDEIETIFPNRATIDDSSCSAERKSMLTCFWQYLDRWDTPQLFLLATNLREHLDTALLSRIPVQLEFGPPTKAQALQVLEYWTETLHEHGSEVWSKVIRDRIEQNPPTSFRELWLSIAAATRQWVTHQGGDQ